MVVYKSTGGIFPRISKIISRALYLTSPSTLSISSFKTSCLLGDQSVEALSILSFPRYLRWYVRDNTIPRFSGSSYAVLVSFVSLFYIYFYPLFFLVGATTLTLTERPLTIRLTILTWSLWSTATDSLLTVSGAPYNYTFKPDRCPFRPPLQIWSPGQKVPIAS